MIKISRLDKSIDYNIDYEIYIDGVNMGRIKSGEAKNFNLRIKKTYEIEIKSSEYTSQKIKFELYDNQIIELICYPIHKNNFMSTVIFKWILSGKGIKLLIDKNFYV